MRGSLTVSPSLVSVEPTCTCGEPATANGLECGRCFRERLRSVRLGSMEVAKNKAWDRRLNDYAATRAEGIQPTSTNQRDITEAKRASDETGRAFRSDRVALAEV